MPLTFGTGELAARLRTALDLRGRIPLMLDEMVVPVALAVDATQAPFRTDGIAWAVGLNFAGAAGNFSSVGVVAETRASAVVTQVVITNNNATAAAYALIILGSTYAASDAFSTERPLSPSGGPNIPIDISSTDLGAAALPAGTPVLAQFWLQGGTSIVVPVDFLLSGQVAPGSNPGLAVAVLAAGSGVAASFSGKYYTPLVNPAG